MSKTHNFTIEVFRCVSVSKAHPEALTLQVVRHSAHELAIQPDLYDGLAYSHWHTDERHEEIRN